MSLERFAESATSARDYPLEAVAEHIEIERREVSLLGEIREIIFGAQDGLVSTLAVVAAVAGATSDNVTVLIAGLASAIAGIFSMSVGEYMGSKSQEEIFAAQVDAEWQEVRHRPFESEAEVAYLFMKEGMDEEDAWTTSALLAKYPRALLSTMVNKELGLTHEDQEETEGSPLRGALFMGGSFAVGGLVPIVPFLFTEGIGALIMATIATGAVLFGLGAIKSRWTDRFWLWSGLEILSLAAVAGVAGYFFGTVLPTILGFANVV